MHFLMSRLLAHLIKSHGIKRCRIFVFGLRFGGMIGVNTDLSPWSKFRSDGKLKGLLYSAKEGHYGSND